MNLPLPTPPVLFAVMVVGEAILMRRRLSKDASRQADRGSLRLLLVVIGASVGLARLVKFAAPQATFAALFGGEASAIDVAYWIGLGLFAGGLALRWYSMAYLGRFFTFDVAVAADHQVIDSGPYRLVRHPAYTGSLLSFTGLGLCGGNVASLAVLVVPIALAFLYRIRVEEAALASSLGRRYLDYAGRTKRLVPFVW